MRSTAPQPRTKGVAAVVTAAAAAALLALAAPASAASTTWTVSLAASAADVTVGSSVTLTATANQSVTGTRFFIDIYDQTTGTPIDYCSTGSTCQVPVSQAQAGSHTYVAYVDSDKFFEYPPCCVQAVSNTVTVRWHARATAAMDVQFEAGGTLPSFPCPAGCSATFSGSGKGGGSARAESSGVQYDATFTMLNGSVSGTASYTEPASPFCPVIGSASGTVTLQGSATGVVSRSSTPTTTGSVTGVKFTLNYTYERAGPATAITIPSGTALISVYFPGTGSTSFISSVTGAGAGAFRVDAQNALAKCQSPGGLPFTIDGDAELTLT